MKSIKKIFLLMVLFLSSITVLAYGNETEAFYYDSINVDIEIKEKGILEVTETRNLEEEFILIYLKILY